MLGKFVMKRRNPLVEKINHEKEENIHIVRKRIICEVGLSRGRAENALL